MQCSRIEEDDHKITKTSKTNLNISHVATKSTYSLTTLRWLSVPMKVMRTDL